MARYDYRCEDCTEIFEVNLPMGQQRPPQQCPVCQGYDTHKVIFTAPALCIEWGPNHVGDIGLPTFKKAVRSKLEGYLTE